jgi:tRNA dimethylallyltransferase
MQPEALCLVGPTASGKSAVALALAERLPVEIISMDSALVYRGMDIGTAKPSLPERAAAPHHLIDILDPAQAYSAAQFVADAQRLVRDIRARGRLPLVVGGTLMYLNALRQGLHKLPPADAEVRAALEQRAAARGWPALHAELARVDPATAARLAPADGQRIQRALEVWHVSGRPLSAWHANVEPRDTAPGATWPVVSLEPRSRAWLHQRIEDRFTAMVRAGFLDEVRRLRARGDLQADLPSMRCVGYRQAWEELDYQARKGPDAPLNIANFRERGIVATRQLAKRQVTWLRSMPERHAIACDHPTAVAELVQAVLLRLNQAERSAGATA